MNPSRPGKFGVDAAALGRQLRLNWPPFLAIHVAGGFGAFLALGSLFSVLARLEHAAMLVVALSVRLGQPATTPGRCC